MPPPSDEQWKRLEGYIKTALESASDDRRRTVETIELLTERLRLRSKESDRLHQRLDAIADAVEELGHAVESIPIDTLKRMDKKTLDSLRRLQHLQATVPGTELPPPPVNGGGQIEVQSRVPWKDRSDDDTGVRIPLPFTKGEIKKIKMGIVRKAIAALGHAITLGAGAALTYAWHLMSHAR